MAVTMIPFIGLAPDMPNMTPGVLTAASFAIPTQRGMRRAPTLSLLAGVDALAAECRGAAMLRKLDGSTRLFAGTQTKLYELSGSAWADRSAGGGSYTGSSTNRWSFAQFGDISLATNDTENIQQSSSGAFAAIANAPKARIVIAVPNFAVAFNTQDGSASTVFGDSPDRWWCSAYQAATDWAINATNQCVSERLIGGGGEITAAAPFGTGWVAYKRRDMFHAYYSGDSAVFTTQRVHGGWGCVGPDAVCDIGNAHFVVGEDDIYIYDGARPVSVADGKVRDWFYRTQLDQSQNYKLQTSFDRARGIVWVWFRSQSGSSSEAMTYHVQSGKWGFAYTPVETLFTYTNAYGSDSVGAFNTSHQVGTLTDTAHANNMGLITGLFGSDDAESMLHRVQLLSQALPSSALGYNAFTYGRSGGASSTGGALSWSSTGNIDLRQTAHWHSLYLSLAGDCEVLGMQVHMRPAGRGR